MNTCIDLGSARPADVFISELNHRWFNGLQVIAAGLRLCGRDGGVGRIPALCDQVQAMAALHRRLSLPPCEGDLERHCRALCLDVLLAFGRTEVTPWVSMLPVPLSPHRAQHLALLVVELMTNALKHGCAPAAGGYVCFRLGPHADGLELVVEDNFLEPSIAAAGPPRIVAALTEILEGTLCVETALSYVTRVRFPLA
jgi:two-component sensor histidine kinase